MSGVPIIDVSRNRKGSVDPEVVDAVADAAIGSGFFQIVGHGIPDSQVREVWNHTP